MNRQLFPHSPSSRPVEKQLVMVEDQRRLTFLLVFAFPLLLSHWHLANALQGGRLSLASQFLGPHNAVRSAVRMPPLRWDARVARYAKWYANQRRGDCALRHSNGPYGENIFWGSGTGWKPAQAVAAWSSESKWYRYGTNSCVWGQMCGHYTQMVWQSSRRLGCAMVTCSGGRGMFMTCNYDPPGNYIGERPY